VSAHRVALLAEEVRTLGRRLENSDKQRRLGQRAVTAYCLLQTLPPFINGTATASDASQLVSLVEGLIKGQPALRRGSAKELPQ
jgi:hypothetical protein